MKISRRKFAQENPTKDKGVIDTWLDQNGDQSVDRLVKKNLAIACKIQEVLERKHMKAVDLATKMGKQKSEISKWLSGQHTFSMRTITAIEAALDCDIVHVEPKVNNVYFTAYVRHDSTSSLEDYDKFEDSSYTGEYVSA